MNIIYINGFGARENSPYAGVFVTKRIQALRDLGIDISPEAYYIKYPKVLQGWLRMKGIPDAGKPLNEQMGVIYKVSEIQLGIFEAVFGKFIPIILQKKIFKVFDRELKNNSAKLVHLHGMWPLGMGLMKLSEKKKIPYVVTCHGSEVNYAMSNPCNRKKFVEVLEKAFRVEFVSKALLNRAIEQGYSGSNAEIITNGIDTDIFQCDVSEVNSRNSVGFVGNLLRVKGADRLPDIFRRILDLYDSEVRFVVIGDGPLREELESEMRDLPVEFTGQVSADKLPEEYGKMKVLIVPSRNEGYSCVIKEAQACGVVPVGIEVGGIPEAIGDYGSAISSDSQENICDSIAEEVVAYLQGKKQIDIKKMSNEALEKSWKYYQRKSVRIYESIRLKGSEGYES